ncbi:alkylmercury lyase family protein [Planotetraspora mira]|uniref:Membrane protein n=1 Tax=Planotetraspora mira TaxID=58121 RepID=A0A8J3XED5_9ACTN|nr:alkylmercury lyase family protein [Planotetraspora mira]GII33378.1 membrane protein [Planotetraspora mira]
MSEGPRERIRSRIYSTLATEGRAPSIAELARVLGTSDRTIRRALIELAERHLFVLNRDGDAIRMAHPFSAAPMAFVVAPADGHDERRWWGGCAWDSFGISACLHLDVLIDTTCPFCGTHLRIEAGPERPPSSGPVVRFPRPAAEWWDDVVATCTDIRLFCSTDHAAGWMTATGTAIGEIVSAEIVWRLSQPWYGDRLDPDYQPHTAAANQMTLAELGLTGTFWELP